LHLLEAELFDIIRAELDQSCVDPGDFALDKLVSFL
jgi:hypothetical protein